MCGQRKEDSQISISLPMPKMFKPSVARNEFAFGIFEKPSFAALKSSDVSYSCLKKMSSAFLTLSIRMLV
jgi:hypothetical protein